MADPKISGVITDVITHLRDKSEDGSISPSLLRISEWSHRGLLTRSPSAVVTCSTEAADEELPQEFEGVVDITLYMWGGRPEKLAPQLRGLTHSVRKQLEFKNKRYGGARLFFERVRYQGWFEGDDKDAPEARAYMTYRALYQENVE